MKLVCLEEARSDLLGMLQSRISKDWRTRVRKVLSKKKADVNRKSAAEQYRSVESPAVESRGEVRGGTRGG